jgi:hypothetical protein
LVFWPAVKVLALLFASLAVWQALAGRSGDLVETRRHFRVILWRLARDSSSQR